LSLSKVLRMKFKVLLACLSVGLVSTSLAKSEKKVDPSPLRKRIGPVYSPPVALKDNLYFLGSSGALYESNLDQTVAKEIYKTSRRTVAEILLEGTTLYFGDGMHEDKRSTLYAFDLKAKKLLFKVSVDGHIEKKPAIKGDLLITGLGPGGLTAFDKHSGKIIWNMRTADGKALHIDSSPVIRGNDLFVGSIYDQKMILCVRLNDGKIIWKYETAKSPKSDLLLSNDKIVSLTSDGKIDSEDREVPSDLIVLEADTGKLVFKKPLRGSNYFPQLISNDKAFVSLSTGDIIDVDLKNGNINPVDQYPEPFMASTFQFQNQNCAVSLMGRLFCYKGGKLSYKRELGEINIGKVASEINHRIYLPSRAGFAVLSKTESAPASNERQ
jgi:outer membrane protein assembly factor BamB